jgi:hypothetical protein
MRQNRFERIVEEEFLDCYRTLVNHPIAHSMNLIKYTFIHLKSKHPIQSRLS